MYSDDEADAVSQLTFRFWPVNFDAAGKHQVCAGLVLIKSLFFVEQEMAIESSSIDKSDPGFEANSKSCFLGRFSACRAVELLL